MHNLYFDIIHLHDFLKSSSLYQQCYLYPFWVKDHTGSVRMTVFLEGWEDEREFKMLGSGCDFWLVSGTWDHSRWMSQSYSSQKCRSMAQRCVACSPISPTRIPGMSGIVTADRLYLYPWASPNTTRTSGPGGKPPTIRPYTNTRLHICR